jgi:hypothetical protein
LVAQVVVVCGAEDHMRIVGRVAADGVHRRAAVAQLEVGLVGRDQHQHAACAGEINAFEQRAGLGGLGGAVGPPAWAVPIIALPGSLITVFTSSKSKSATLSRRCG